MSREETPFRFLFTSVRVCMWVRVSLAVRVRLCSLSGPTYPRDDRTGAKVKVFFYPSFSCAWARMCNRPKWVPERGLACSLGGLF